MEEIDFLEEELQQQPKDAKATKNGKKQPRNVGGVVSICLWVTFGAYIGFISSTFEMPLIISFLFLLASIFISAAIHEFGHLVCGLVSGYKFLSFRVGAIMLAKQNGKYKLKLFNVLGTLGQCLLDPPDYTKDLKTTLYNLGGVLFNFIAILVCVGLLFAPLGAIASVFVLIIMGCNVIFAITNGIPMRCGYIFNDGKNIVFLNKDERAKYSFWLQLKINALSTNNVRLTDMPNEYFFLAEDADYSNALIQDVVMLNCNRALETQNYESALHHAKFLVDVPNCLPTYVSLAQSVQILCVLMLDQDVSVVDVLLTKQLEQFMKVAGLTPSVICAKYAILQLYEPDENQLKKWNKLHKKFVKTYPFEVEKEWVQVIIDAITEKAKTAKTPSDKSDDDFDDLI